MTMLHSGKNSRYSIVLTNVLQCMTVCRLFSLHVKLLKSLNLSDRNLTGCPDHP